MEAIKIDHFSNEEQQTLQDLIKRRAQIFMLRGDKLESKITTYHEIKTKPHPSIHVKNYRFPYVHREGVEKQMTEYLKQGIIQPSHSPWNAPIWIVPKKMDNSGHQKWRIVVDYRKLNEITLEDMYPLIQNEVHNRLLDYIYKYNNFTNM